MMDINGLHQLAKNIRTDFQSFKDQEFNSLKEQVECENALIRSKLDKLFRIVIAGLLAIIASLAVLILK
jgi:hypothetical protein